MSYDRGLVERVRDSLARLGERGIREKNVFSGWGFLLGTRAFAIAWTDGLIVKLAPEEYEDMRARPGVKPFAPGGERPMGTWLVATADSTADDLDLAEWVGRGLRGVRAVPLARGRPKRAAAPSAESSARSARSATSATSAKRDMSKKAAKRGTKKAPSAVTRGTSPKSAKQAGKSAAPASKRAKKVASPSAKRGSSAKTSPPSRRRHR